MRAHWFNSGVSPSAFEWKGGETLNPATGLLLEVVIGEPNFKSIWWLESAIRAAKSVARVKLPAGSQPTSRRNHSC